MRERTRRGGPIRRGLRIVASGRVCEAARQQLNVLGTEIAAKADAAARREADLRTARLNLGYTDIRAPIDGYVGNRAAEVGAYVTAGTDLLSVVPAPGCGSTPTSRKTSSRRMEPGEAATIVADVLPGHAFHGHVASLAPGTGAVFSVIPPENATGNFTKIVQRVPVRILLDGDDADAGACCGPACPPRSASIPRRRRAVITVAPQAAVGAALRGDVRRHVHRAAGHPDRRVVACRISAAACPPRRTRSVGCRPPI